MPILDGYYASGFVHNSLIVGGKYEGNVFLPVQLFHDVEQRFGRFRIEVGSRLIGQNKFWL